MADGKDLARRPRAEMQQRRVENILIEDARIVFRNFAGRESMYNAEGSRNFCVLLDRDLAERMMGEGWNIRFLKPREEGDEPQPYIQIAVGYKIRPPRVLILTSAGKKELEERQLESLDYLDIETADVIFRPYMWTLASGRSGIKAYLKTLFVKIREDYLELKYADVPELGGEGSVVELEITGGVNKADDYDGMDIVDAEIVED